MQNFFLTLHIISSSHPMPKKGRFCAKQHLSDQKLSSPFRSISRKHLAACKQEAAASRCAKMKNNFWSNDGLLSFQKWLGNIETNHYRFTGSGKRQMYGRTTSIYCQFCLNDAQDKLIKPSRNGLQSYQRSPIQELNDGYDFRRYSQDQNHHKRLQCITRYSSRKNSDYCRCSALEDTEVRNDVRDVQNDINCTIDDLMALTIIE